jgi:hypothetical protein
MLEVWLNRYYYTFGESYPLMITAPVDSEAVISDIKRCIEGGELAVPMELDPSLDY